MRFIFCHLSTEPGTDPWYADTAMGSQSVSLVDDTVFRLERALSHMIDGSLTEMAGRDGPVSSRD
ncbi:hypothetical protein B1756_09085 [Natrarchaeobaculum aegyptiacum]|uniref:Uncharacterized protein n=1 Tax=Natrarchaeobaculum aegyptiacum TaxID=745377 RepID=A0A2Z2HS13_9EURY|nr:hypothetical protein B1756_09085 [Natrarchaeobaculum aegyptiacum]